MAKKKEVIKIYEVQAPIIEGGVRYNKGDKIELTEERAKALGNLVKEFKEEETGENAEAEAEAEVKAVENPEQNKMIEGASNK